MYGFSPIYFSNEQTDTLLEGIFDRKKYLTNAEQKRLAKALALSEGQVSPIIQLPYCCAKLSTFFGPHSR
jgi:hypothetical protein